MSKIKNDERIKVIIEEFEDELDTELKQYQHLENGHKIVLINFFKERGYIIKESEIYINLRICEYYFLGNGIDKINRFEEENPEMFI